MYKHFVIIFMILLSSLSCVNKETKALPEDLQYQTDHSLDTSKYHTQGSDIIGKIELNSDGSYVLIRNWESRSRIILKVTPESQILVKGKQGKILKVAGTIKKTSLLRGTINITEVLFE